MGLIRVGKRFRNGFTWLHKGFVRVLQGYVTGLVVSNVEALISRIGFWGHYTAIIVRNPQNSIGNYFGPDIRTTDPKPSVRPVALQETQPLG